MERTIAEQLLGGAEEGSVEMELRERYSGSAAGIVVSNNLDLAVAAVLATVDLFHDLEKGEAEGRAHEMVNALRKLRRDSLGSNTIIY